MLDFGEADGGRTVESAPALPGPGEPTPCLEESLPNVFGSGDTIESIPLAGQSLGFTHEAVPDNFTAAGSDGPSQEAGFAVAIPVEHDRQAEESCAQEGCGSQASQAQDVTQKDFDGFIAKEGAARLDDEGPNGRV